MFPPVKGHDGPHQKGWDDETMLVPDAISTAPVAGIRQWRVQHTPQGSPISLRSVSYSYTWQPGLNDAVCNKRDGSGDPLHPRVGYPGCGCGFWAYGNTDDSWYHTTNPPKFGDGTTYVEGIIEAQGLVTRGAKGFRAEKARIVALVAVASNTRQDPDWIVTRTTLARRAWLDYGIADIISERWALAGEHLEWYPTREAMVAAHPLTAPPKGSDS